MMVVIMMVMLVMMIVCVCVSHDAGTQGTCLVRRRQHRKLS